MSLDCALIFTDFKCPACGGIYWAEEGCLHCGYPETKQLPNGYLKDGAPSTFLRKEPWHIFSNEERELLRRYLDFYQALHSGLRKPTTRDQEHFLQVCRGKAKPRTPHETAYVRYIISYEEAYSALIDMRREALKTLISKRYDDRTADGMGFDEIDWDSFNFDLPENWPGFRRIC